VLGFDFGLARIGVAVSSPLTGVASSLTVLHARQGEPDWAGILQLVREWRPVVLVVGMPRKLDGSPSAMQEAITAFVRRLGQQTGLPVELANEQLSSREAEQRLRLARQSGRKRKVRKEEIDQLAAVIILENWMQEREQGGYDAQQL